MKTFEVSTAQLESRFIDARQSGNETHEGGEKRRILSRPLSSAQRADSNIITLRLRIFYVKPVIVVGRRILPTIAPVGSRESGDDIVRLSRWVSF
jgi:hypothetical protein